MFRVMVSMGLIGSLLTAQAPAPKFEFPDFSKHAAAWRGEATGVKGARYCVVDTSNAWKALWKEHAPKAVVPVVDFSNSMVLAVFNPQWTTAAFRIEKVVLAGSFTPEHSYNVFMTEQAKLPRNRFEMVQVDRTRFDFRFYSHGDWLYVSKAQQVARVDSPAGEKLTAPALAMIERLLKYYSTGSSNWQSGTIAKLAAFGEPVRPFSNRILNAGTGEHPGRRSGDGRQREWAARAVLAMLDAKPVGGEGKPIHHSEVALARAMALLNERWKGKHRLAWVRRRISCRDAVWFLRLHVYSARGGCGTYLMSSPLISDLAFRAKDGKLLHLAQRAGPQAIIEVGSSDSPHVTFIGEEQKK